MDAFYASVEIRERPELADKPVVVGGPADSRGVVSAANYVARSYGIYSAMATATALKHCPELIVLPGRMELYVGISRQIRKIFSHYTPLVEPLSLDEAFLDVTASEALFGGADSIGRNIKKEIADQLNLVVSVGIAPNKFIAKIASDVDKPDGFVSVKASQQQGFLDPLPVKRIWGVGRVTEQSLALLGIKTIFDLRTFPQKALLDQFGKLGLHLWRLAHGIDDRQVVPSHEAKSISHETTFAKDLTDRDYLLAHLLHLTEQVAARLRDSQLRGRTVQLKVRFEDFQTITRSATLDNATDSTQTLWKCTKMLYKTRLPRNHKAIRLIGMGVSGFDHKSDSSLGIQQDLFEATNPTLEKVDKLTDEINRRFGKSTLQRGTTFKR